MSIDPVVVEVGYTLSLTVIYEVRRGEVAELAAAILDEHPDAVIEVDGEVVE